MGAEITKTDFTSEDIKNFQIQLKNETELLKKWIDEKKFCNTGYSGGIELEATLVSSEFEPQPVNHEFLEKLNHPQIVHELAKYNIEMNGTPFPCKSNFLRLLKEDISEQFKLSQACAESLNTHILLIGTLPTLKKNMLNLKSLTEAKRYEALNKELFSPQDQLRQNYIHISGDRDILKMTTSDIMAASTATSFQFQWKFPIELATRAFNLSSILAAPMVAVSANSPFVLGKELWKESRVPLFEHALSGSPRQHKNQHISRTLFGRGYLQKSFYEFYEQNLHHFPCLLPISLNTPPEEFSYLNFHNGTIWRWNRPVIGKNPDGSAHIRIEHRIPPSGPTIDDSLANLAFFLGMMMELTHEKTPLEMQIPFVFSEKSFYMAAKHGMGIDIAWTMNRTRNLKSLLLEELIPAAERGLQRLGIDDSDIKYYLRNIMYPRVFSEQNGANWQIQFMRQNKCSLAEMTEQYYKNQQSEKPVHLWKI